MTANAAQAIVDPRVWRETLRGAYGALRPGGRLVFETRDPVGRAWEEWNREASYSLTEIPGVGAVESWVELVEVSGPLVTFRGTYVFAADGRVLTSDSTLRFRERQEVETELTAQGYVVEDVRDAPDRPGKELVFVARSPWTGRRPAHALERLVTAGCPGDGTGHGFRDCDCDCGCGLRAAGCGLRGVSRPSCVSPGRTRCLRGRSSR